MGASLCIVPATEHVRLALGTRHCARRQAGTAARPAAAALPPRPASARSVPGRGAARAPVDARAAPSQLADSGALRRVGPARSGAVRMHAGAAPAGGFTDEQLRPWAARVRALARSGKDVHVYFNNDREEHACEMRCALPRRAHRWQAHALKRLRPRARRDDPPGTAGRPTELSRGREPAGL